jgi:hypothetical protein
MAARRDATMTIDFVHGAQLVRNGGDRQRFASGHNAI